MVLVLMLLFTSFMFRWIGNLGKHATHVVLAAQLVVDGKNYGLHWFVLQVREQKTHRTLPGISIGDIGPKPAWNSLDNGFLLLDNVRVKREALLNKVKSHPQLLLT